MKKYIIAAIGAFLSLTGCHDFLEPSSPNEFIPKNADALNEMLLGEAYPDGKTNMFALYDILDDDVSTSSEDGFSFQPGITGANATGEVLQAYYSWNPDVYEVATTHGIYYGINPWEQYYACILGTNAALDYIDDMDDPEAAKNEVRGQAYALRAFFYFNLVNFYAIPYIYDKNAPGVPLKLVSAVNPQDEKRKSVGEVYAQIISDLDNAEKAYLGISEDKRFKRNYRVSLPMVYLLRSRVYLHMGEYGKAAADARKIVEDERFSLYDLRTFSPSPKEPYPEFVTFNNPEVVWAYGAESGRSLRDIQFTDGPTSPKYRYFLIASPKLRDSYDNNDIRKEYYSLIDRFMIGMDEPNYRPLGKCRVTDGYERENRSMAYSMRLSEAYLNLAEAIAESAPSEALELVNQIREKRIKSDSYTKVTGLTGDALLKFIREERRRELCFEGHRWFDLRRYGMPSFSHEWYQSGERKTTFTIQEKDGRYVLPLHPETLRLNPSLRKTE
ncbi:RagB/SusD family nutrient uptake outer membrane protein [Dysgonomonas sp. UBA7698]|uniref:RagB/SusD family nutrient uptake outer membrane protein n=1 Tax=Dysgonomonas sp. UBA7698 TaxID=1946427 RepID=UPI0025C31FDE|nr:RagB/SusD family nutrient uptake outer membrane protein [Dysgonomonas sp. UBA7698]